MVSQGGYADERGRTSLKCTVCTQPLTLRGERRGMRCDSRNIYKSLGVRGSPHLRARGSPARVRGNPQAVARGGRDYGTPLAMCIGISGISMRVFVIDMPPR